jgi:hypothetical protein
VTLAPIQRGLERLYRLDRAPDVEQFVVAKRDAVPREQLLVRQHNEDLELSLRLDSRLLESARGLEEMLLLVEGVSHFLCVVFRVRQGRPVSALELELQAEVDKFLACLALARRRRPGPPPHGLGSRLLGRFVLAPQLPPCERQRYRTAATLGRRYAGSLESRFLLRGRARDMADELRRFYRMGLAEKRAHIEHRAA